MKTFKHLLVICALSATASAQPAPPGDGSAAPSPPADGSATTPPPADGTTTTTTTPPADATTTTTPPPADATTTTAPPPAEPPPPPAPPPTPPPAPPPTPAPAPASSSGGHSGISSWFSAGRPRCKRDSDEYYSCERGYGIFHSLRLVVGALSANAPQTTTDPMTGAQTMNEAAVTAGEVVFEGGFLGMPSSFAPTNFHGIEFSTGIRTSKFDFWMSFGTAVTFLNLGHGGMGTLRVGGSFGAGFNFAHGFGYIRGRAAAILLPEKLDAEFSVQWTPPSASTSNYDEQNWRLSLWYRYSHSSRKAVELYFQKVKRVDSDPMVQKERELIDGVGGGVGISFL